MPSFLFTIAILITGINGCSLPAPVAGKYYISELELLSTDTYPDSVLLTIRRISYETIECKLMNVTDGSLDAVACEDYTTFVRSFPSPDIDPRSSNVSCSDNCDGTATCIITRDGINYTINDIPYTTSSSSCTTPAPDIWYNTDIAISFTMNNRSTTYISFSLNMVGVRFDDNTTSVGYNVINVDRAGDGWEYIMPNEFDITMAPEIYSDVNVIKHELPCCVCYDTALNTYTIEPDSSGSYDETFTMNPLTWGGFVDSVKQRVYRLGVAYPEAVTMYDLSTGSENTFPLDPSTTTSDPASRGSVCAVNVIVTFIGFSIFFVFF